MHTSQETMLCKDTTRIRLIFTDGALFFKWILVVGSTISSLVTNDSYCNIDGPQLAIEWLLKHNHSLWISINKDYEQRYIRIGAGASYSWKCMCGSMNNNFAIKFNQLLARAVAKMLRSWLYNRNNPCLLQTKRDEDVIVVNHDSLTWLIVFVVGQTSDRFYTR